MTEKKLNNRFDQYEIASVFTEYAEDYIPNKWKIVRRNFYIRCLLGVLLFVNAYLSHWGPWPWPTNFWLLVFSVIFYHTATYFYSLTTPVNNQEGNTIGFYKVGDKVITAVLRIGKNKQIYTFQLMDCQEKIKSKQMLYYDYFTESGVFLKWKFRKVLDNVMDSVQGTDK